MTQQNLAELSEMYSLDEKQPTIKHANSRGEVLWYGPSVQFWSGPWNTTLGTYTHWRMLPDPPQRAETRYEYLDRMFAGFLEKHAPNVTAEELTKEQLALRNQLHRAFMSGAEL